jgi:hypothetical protein
MIRTKRKYWMVGGVEGEDAEGGDERTLVLMSTQMALTLETARIRASLSRVDEYLRSCCSSRRYLCTIWKRSHVASRDK